MLITAFIIVDHLVKGLYIEQPGFEKVRRLMNEKAVKVIFVPLTRSMVDISVLQLINVLHEIEIGFSIIGIDDLPMKWFMEAFKNLGAIFMKLNDLWRHSVSYTFQSLLESIVSCNKVTTICMNKVRLRSGKI